MARRYVRDAKGRFAGKGFSGQTGGRGARLKSGKGNIREVGGQKRGERHILRSAETKAASKKSFDASVQSGNIILPKKLGGQGMPRGSFMAQAASRKKAQAVAERDSALRKSGLPKSGGAMRVKGGLKRDPNAGQKLAANKISKSPRQLNKDEKIARDVMTDKRFKSDRQRVTEMQRRGVKPGVDVVGLVANVRSKQGGGTTSKIKPATKSGRETMKASVRKVQNQKVRNLNRQIKEAGPNAAGLRLEKLKVQSRMSATRATPTAKQTAKSAQRNDAIRARSAELRRQAGRVSRAYANQARTADTRNKPGSSMIRRPSRKTTRGAIRAEQALKFYRDPKRALNSVNKKRPGFRMPRGMRK